MKAKSNNGRSEITMNNNSIMPLVLYLSFPFPLSNLISQGTTASRKEVFPWYHTGDYSSTGGKMKRINKEKIEFLQPLQERQPMNQQNKFSPEINKHDISAGSYGTDGPLSLS